MDLGSLNLGTGLEMLRPWITTGGILALLGIVAKLYVDNRRLRLEETTGDRKYQLEVSEDGRSNLQFIINNLRDDIKATREAHTICEERLRELNEKHDGLQRQFIAYQVTVARAIPPDLRSPAVNAVLSQLDDLADNPILPVPATNSDGTKPD